MGNLKRIRMAKGLSQSQLAKLSGVNLRMIQKYELYTEKINTAYVMTVYKLAKALDCEIIDLLEFDKEE